MPKGKSISALSFLFLPIVSLVSGPHTTVRTPGDQTARQAPRPIELRDILAWKSIVNPALSPDGRWFGYRLSPLEGDGDVVVRETGDPKEYRFPAGESRSTEIAFSDDSKYCAFLVHPTAKESKALRKDKKTIYTQASVLNLATGDKVEYEKIRSFRFSGENPAWLALLKTPPEAQAREKDKWTGSDLILRELATGKELTIGNVAEFAFDKKGRRLALAIDAQGQTGNGLQLRDMATGALSSRSTTTRPPTSRLSWTEKGEALACLKGKEDKAYEDKLWSVLAFTGFRRTAKRPAPEDRLRPGGRQVLPGGHDHQPRPRPRMDREASTPSSSASTRPRRKEGRGQGRRPATASPRPAPPPAPGGRRRSPTRTSPTSSSGTGQDKRLQSQQQVQETADKSFSYLAEYRVAEKKFIRLADDDLRDGRAGAQGPLRRRARTTGPTSSTATSTAAATRTSTSST